MANIPTPQTAHNQSPANDDSDADAFAALSALVILAAAIVFFINH